MLGEEIVNRE